MLGEAGQLDGEGGEDAAIEQVVGGITSTPVINRPEVAIVAVNKLKEVR